MVLPFIGAGIATGIGTLAGLSLGPYLFTFIKPQSFRGLSEEVDHDRKVPAPAHGLLVQSDLRDRLPLLEPWLTDPKYDRAAMINRLLATMWPTMTKAILDMAITGEGEVYNSVLQPQLKAQVFDKYPFIEDILLGPHSLRSGKAAGVAELGERLFTLGGPAPRVGGFKVVPTADDEVLLETSMAWGSTATFDVTAILRFGPLRLVVPLQLANISFKADLRVVLRPLVEQFPCLGGVSISLLRIPVVDCSLSLVRGVDLMALPLVPQLVHTAMRLVLEPLALPFLNRPLVPGIGCVLPNAMSFALMPNFGLPPSPVGALKVEILELDGVKGGNDLYCRMEVRRGRFQRTRTVANDRSPRFNEEFALIVDTFEYDQLRIHVMNDDLGQNDTKLSEVVLPFGEVAGVKTDPKTGKEVTDFQLADFIQSRQPQLFMLSLKRAARKHGKIMGAASKSFSAVSKGASFAASSTRNTFARLFRLKSAASKKAALSGAQAGKDGAESGAESGGRDDGGGQLAAAGGPSARASANGSAPTLGSLPASGTRVRSARHAPGGAPWEDPKDNIGTIKFKVTFIPFNEPRFDDELREAEAAATRKDPRLNTFPPPLGRAMNAMGGGGGLLRGVLTVHLIRCVDLAPEGAKDMATYVRMMVTNEEKDEEQCSKTIETETSPRWGDKFDFVLIPAASSELHINVLNRAGLLGNLVGSLMMRKKEDKDNSMGRLVIRVADVARNGKMRDTWALQGAERGYIELALSWQTCYVNQDQI